MTVGELLGRISSSEITEWGQLFKIQAWERESGRNANQLYEPGVELPQMMGGGPI